MNKSRKYLTTPLTAAVAAALSPAQIAMAQDQDQDHESSGVLEEVIVTATFRAVSMQDLPQSINAFSNEDIVRNAFQDFTDVANALPSLTLIADMPGRYSVKFRGVSTGTGEYYTGSVGAIYLDETPLTFNSQQLFPEPVDIERIESLPGPQGTFFGAASLSGTLRIITNKPDPTAFSGEVFGEYYATDGGAGSWALNGHVNIPIVQDTLALRLVAYTRDDGGWIDNVYGESYVKPNPSFTSTPVSQDNNSAYVKNDWNQYTNTGGRAALRWDITEDWATTLSFLGEEGKAKGNWAEDTNLQHDQIALFHDEFRTDKWWTGALLIEGDLGFATLTSSTTYLDRDITYEWENMIYEQWKDSFFGVYYGFTLYNTEYTYGYIFNEQTQDRFSQEIRLQSQSDSRFQWMVGGFYEKINDNWYYGAQNPDLMETVMWYYANYWAYYYNYYGYDVNSPLTPTTVGYANWLDRTNEQLAFFGEISFDFTDQWSATFGARWFEYKQKQTDTNQFPQGLPVWGTFDTQGSYFSDSKDSDSVFKFSTEYHFDDDKMVYFLFSQGFRPGGNNSQRAANTGLVPAAFAPDFLNNWEIGLKSQWLDNSLQFNLNFFYMDWNDRQFNEGSVDGQWWLNGTVNAGDTETKGVEMNASWAPTDKLLFNFNYTYVDAEASSYYEFLNGDIMQPGDALPNSPKHAYWIAADYTLPWTPWNSNMWVRLDYAYGDEWWNSTSSAINQDPEGLIPSWKNMNLQLAMELPSEWTITAFVNNLTNERRVTSRQSNAYASDWFGTENYRIFEYIQRPRNYGINFRKRF